MNLEFRIERARGRLSSGRIRNVSLLFIARSVFLTTIAALLNDLRQRGLLDDTLVSWGSEFGRTIDQPKRHGALLQLRGTG
jgi:Protein of unknown function (DUF1501)